MLSLCNLNKISPLLKASKAYKHKLFLCKSNKQVKILLQWSHNDEVITFIPLSKIQKLFLLTVAKLFQEKF